MAKKPPKLYKWPTDPKTAKPTHTISWEAHQRHMRVRKRTPSGQPPTGERTVNGIGQMITFAIEDGGDQRFTGYTYVLVSKTNNTIKKIVKNRGHLTADDIRLVCDLNNIRNPNSKLAVNRRIRLPDRLRESQRVHILAGDTPPVITGGYAKIAVVDRTERAGISTFTGYDPITIDVPVRFETEDFYGSWGGADGSKVEADIARIEEFAGRGNFSGAAVGPPPIIRVSVRDNNGKFVGLLSRNYQYVWGNENAPVYWISGIDWDTEAQRNDQGERIRQLATIQLTEYVNPAKLVPSAAERAKALQKKPKKGTKK